MVDYQDSSQLNQWLFASNEQMEECRARANHDARVWLVEQDKQAGVQPSDSSENTTNINNNVSGTGADSSTPASKPSTAPPMALFFACGYKKNKEKDPSGTTIDYTSQGPSKNIKGHEFLTPTEESTLISFYASKLATLIGPKASIPRLLRESKITATAALLYRRFFLSNSVMIFDPKAVLVASAFLASKVEDAMADVRNLQEGTEKMQAPVTQQEIISAELALLQGCHYDLLCFHPFKSVLALTEDLRTFLKSDKGQNLVQRPISGQDLKPIYDKARLILEQVTICSDLTLLFSPGPIGLASLIVAQDEILAQSSSSATTTAAQQQQQPPPRIDFYGYVLQRFPEKTEASSLLETLPILCDRLRALPQGNIMTTNETLAQLKQIHKKLKKVRYWGASSSTSDSSSKKKKKKKTDQDSESMPPPKRVKMEE
ncbi:hypothetical protein ACA910_002550 [Epithemia clementina (nom. ined.)]